MAMSTRVLLITIATTALLATRVMGCSSDASVPKLFTDTVPWGCAEPFDCFLDFCACVNGTFSATCTPFGTVDVETLERCSARRVTCTLNAALNARNVWNSSCQMWGDDLSKEYATYYADRSVTNLTRICESDLCTVLTAGSELADQVNYSYVCSLVNFTFPAPLGSDEVAGCAAPPRDYIAKAPVASCPSVANCTKAYCACTDGSWGDEGCSWTGAEPSAAVLVNCTSALAGCYTKAALDLYVPGASPLNKDVCLGWSVPIAQDYLAYTNATDKTTTNLWQTCNASACTGIYRYDKTANFSSACAFAAVAGRPATFTAYDPCPYLCPDNTCAASLVNCACTANAVVSNVNATLSRAISPSFDLSKSLTLSAYATYAVPSGNCSTYDFSSQLSFKWTLKKSDSTVVRTSNSSVLKIDASSLMDGETYTATVTATGVVASKNGSASFMFTAMAPKPTVSITDNGASLRVSSGNAVQIKARIVDTQGVTGSFVWACDVIGAGTCPSLTNASRTQLNISAGTTAGTYNITYTYRGEVSSSLTLTVVAEAIPIVRIASATLGLSTSPLAFASTQSVSFASIVSYTSTNISYAWSVNGGDTFANASAAVLAVTALYTTTLADANNGVYTTNQISLRVTSRANPTLYGESTINFVVLAPFTATLTAEKSTGGVTATALTDKLLLTPTSTPALTTASAPFGSAFSVTLVYNDTLGSLQVKSLLSATPSGAAYTATAPLFSVNASSKTVVFTAVLSLNGITVATASSPMTIVAPVASEAATAQIDAASSVTDAAGAGAVAKNLAALISQLPPAQAQAASKAMLDLVIRTVSAASVAQLTPAAAASMLGSLAAAFGASANATAKKEQSEQLQSVVSAALKNYDSASENVYVGAIGAMDDKVAGAVAGDLAAAMSNDESQPVGEEKALVIGGLSVYAKRNLLADLASAQYGGDGTAAMTLPSGFSFAGFDDDAIFGVAGTTCEVAPFGDVPVIGKVATYTINNGGSEMTVSGLVDAIVIVLPGGAGICQYWAIGLSVWSTDGVTTVVNGANLECHTTHLTAFGTPSSATTVALSMLVLVFAAAMQIFVF